MLDIQLIRQDTEYVRNALTMRGTELNIDEILNFDKQRRELLKETEGLKAKRNTASKKIGRMVNDEDRSSLVSEMRKVGDQISQLDQQVRDIESKLNDLMLEIPNIPDADTPQGTNDADNVTIKEVGKEHNFNFTPKPHWDLGVNLGIIDFERGVKLSGSRFYVLNNAGARLQRALISFMLDLHTRQGYSECYLPFMVKEVNFTTAGQLPKFRTTYTMT